MRALAPFEAMVLNFMDRVGKNYRRRAEAAAASGDHAEADEIIADACERYTDWATD